MQILQLTTVVPKSKYSTEKLIDAFPCQLPEGVIENVLKLGVSIRHLIDYAGFSEPETILSESGLVELCADASEKALGKAGLSLDDVGYFVVTYDVNPILCPGLSQLLVREMGFNSNIKHVNLQGMACTAFTKTLELTKDHLAAHPKDSVLICISGANSYWFYNQVRGLKNIMEISKISAIRDEGERQMELRKWIATMEFFLFGDGVASLLVSNEGDGLSVEKIAEITNVGKTDYLTGYARLAALNEPFRFGFYSYLDKGIPELGVRYASMVLKELFGANAGKYIEAARKLAIHTGSEKILNHIAESYNIQRGKIEESFQVLKEHGNLAGASLPFILERIITENELTEDDTILTLGYGWGFSASACSLIRK